MKHAWNHINIVLILLAAASLVVPATAAEYHVAHWDQVQTSATPPATVQGSGTNWSWNLSAGQGYLDIDHDYYSCCNGDVRPNARFRCEDLVFSSPGGGSGTAVVTFDMFIDGAVTGCTATTVTVGAGLGGGSVNLGTWDAGEEGCYAYAATGIFTGMEGPSVQGVFTSPAFTVPLNTPVTFEVSMQTRIGSYQVWGDIDVSLALGGFDTVFNVVDGPEDLTADSAEGGIVDNVWIDPALSPVPRQWPGGDLAVRSAPNPFNPRTRISFTGPPNRETVVTIHDLRGNRIATLFEGRATGESQVVHWNAEGRASGVYFVTVRSGGRATTEKLALLK